MKKDTLASSFPISISFVSFTCLTALAKTLGSILNTYGENGHSNLSPYFNGNFLCFSQFKTMLAMALL